MWHHRKPGDSVNKIFGKNQDNSVDTNIDDLKSCLLERVTILSCDSNMEGIGVKISGLKGQEYTAVSVFHAIQSVF